VLNSASLCLLGNVRSMYLSVHQSFKVAARQHYAPRRVTRWRFHKIGLAREADAGLMTFNALSDHLCDPSVNTATFTRLDTLILELLTRLAH